MSKNFNILFPVLLVLLLVAIIWNLSVGYLDLGITDYFHDTANSQIAALRVNRVVAMLLAGAAIPTSGFLLQEYFQNPLAGPSVLGITAASSLSVAFYIFLSQDWTLPEFLQNSFLSLAAIFGSVVLLVLLLLFSRRFEDKAFIIIFGFLISALAGAVVSVLQFYADNQNLKNYVLWSFGANNMISRAQLYVLIFLTAVGMLLSFKTIKPLIGNALGTAYAQSFGVNLNQLKYLIIVASSVLSASVTAFLGPILFIGIVIPHFSKMVYNPAKLWHQWIINIVLGALVMELFSALSEISQFPLNVITSLFGVPVIMLMMIKSKK